MSDVKQCDRCGGIVSKTEWSHSRRIEAIYRQTSKAATSYSPSSYEICDNCVDEFFTFLEE